MRKSKVVVVTGAGRGIGRGIAQLFFERGFKVAIYSRSDRPRSLPKQMMYCSGDVRNKDNLIGFARDVHRKFGRLDAFVNCAGISRWKEIGAMEEAFLKDTYEVNVLGTMWGCAAAAATMKKGGSIVNVSSLAGKRGSANNSAYCASKFAVNGITQSLAKELGPRGIRVNAVCPVYVATEMIFKSLEEPAAPPLGKSVDDYLDHFAKTQTALGRLPTEQEVAESVFFLASSAASAITGQCINVDCGTLPQ